MAGGKKPRRKKTQRKKPAPRRRVMEGRAPVEMGRAMEHAQLTVRRSWAADVEGFYSWGTTEIDPDPLVIYDLNGEPLFYEFNVMLGSLQTGRVKTSATKRVGSAVPTVEFGERKWDPGKSEREAKKLAQKLHPRSKVKMTALVCYSYPKIGVRVDIGEQSLLFDVSDMSRVTHFEDDDLEGQIAWSFLDEIVAGREEEGERLWEASDEEVEAAHAEAPKAFARGLTEGEANRYRSTFLPRRLIPIPFYSSRVIRFSPRCNPHECFQLYAQKTNVFCAVATGQMILDFYRYYYTQDQIAAAMNTGSNGTSNSNQVTGYETLSHNCLNATYDSSAAWSEARNEINANRPLKSGVPGHARACAGWRKQNIVLPGRPKKRWLKIYDPWPWKKDICKGGQVYWEDWDAKTHTNFIYVRHRTTTHS
jgi:hypothetical protein